MNVLVRQGRHNACCVSPASGVVLLLVALLTTQAHVFNHLEVNSSCATAVFVQTAVAMPLRAGFSCDPAPPLSVCWSDYTLDPGQGRNSAIPLPLIICFCCIYSMPSLTV
jgi:hypothetical protein